MCLTALPVDFLSWQPIWQAAILAVATFVQEDAPTVGSALLAVNGLLAWKTGFWGCFFGIWIGDALLYLVARGFGQSLLGKPWLRRWIDLTAVGHAEKWFKERGMFLLIASRFVPGTRLPTYLAAGLLRVPLVYFLVVTGGAVAIWTGFLFGSAFFLGSELIHWVQEWRFTASVILLVLMVMYLTPWRAYRLKTRRLGLSLTLSRWSRWEFWPAWIFYIPVVLHYLYLSFRYRGLMLPTASNPGIFAGGIVGESKLDILQALEETSPRYTASAWLVEGATIDKRLDWLDSLCARGQLSFPFILKPDFGQRGVGVKLIRSREQSEAYLRQCQAPTIAQQYSPGPFEVGVFYYRFPGDKRGRIFAITEKIFPTIIGDGLRTIEELILADERARLMADTYLRKMANKGGQVLPAGEILRLVEAGNHAQGCIFRDGARLWSEELETRIDEISQRLPGFYIGRYDIRYSDPELFRLGEQFQIVELNGAAAEATSIYDARNSLVNAYRTLFRQWRLVFTIGASNRDGGIPTTSMRELWRRWRETVVLSRTYPLAD